MTPSERDATDAARLAGLEAAAGLPSSPPKCATGSLAAAALPAPGARLKVRLAVALVGFCAFLGLYATQPLLPLFRRTFRASEVMVSLTVSGAVLGVALAAPFVGLIADRLGRKRVIVAALLGLAAATALAATAHDLPALVAWRFVQGLFVPGVVAVTMAYVVEETDAGAIGATMAAYVTGTVVGGFTGRFATGLIATHWGWPRAFVVLGSATLAGAIAVWQALPRARRFVRQANAAASLKAIATHLHNTQLLATYAVGFCVLFSFVGAFTYVGFYLAAPPFHLGPTALGSIFTVYLLGAVITPLAGRWIDRLGYRLSVAAALCLAATGILITLVHVLWLVIGGLAMCATGVFVCQSASSGYVGVAAGHARSSAAGLYVALYYAGGTVGSAAPGLLWSRGGWGSCVALLVALQLATATFACLTWKR